MDDVVLNRAAIIERCLRRVANVAVHQYQILNIDILRQVVEQSRFDLVNFCAALGIKIISANSP